MSKEKGKIYSENFDKWAKSMSDDDFRQIVYAPSGSLNRQQIKKLAGVSDSAIKHNDKVVGALKTLEDGLRERGVLPPLTEKDSNAEPKLYDPSSKQSALDAKRVARLESTNHDLKVRVEALEKENQELRSKLASCAETVEAISDGLSIFEACGL